MKLTYRPEIDGLRAIAVGAVILYHAKITILGHQPFKGGFIGVDIFFVISGYLITSIILKELVTIGSFSFKHFYERRIRRILPALLFMMIIIFPFAWMYLLPNNFLEFLKSLIYSLGFSSNFYFYFSGQEYAGINALFKPLLHTWSLSVEEQFYIVFPIVLFFTYKYFRNYLALILFSIFFSSFLLAEWGSKNYVSITFYFIHSRMWELLAGSILAYFEISSGQRSKNKILNNFLPSIGILLIAHSMFFFHDKMFHPSFYTISPIIGVCLIIWFSNEKEIITKILSNKLFVGVGLISYSLYLWHYPIFAFSRITNSFETDNHIYPALIIIFLSIFSYYFVEKPSRNKSYKFKNIFITVITIYIILLLSGIYFLSGKSLALKNNINEFHQLNKLKGEFNELENTRSDWKKCETEKIIDNNYCKIGNYKNKVYLIGDSHVIPLVRDLGQKLNKKNYELVQLTQSSLIYRRKLQDDRRESFLKKIKNSIFIFGGHYQRESKDDLNLIYEYYKKDFNLFHKNNNTIIFLSPIPEVNFIPQIELYEIKKNIRKSIYINRAEVTKRHELAVEFINKLNNINLIDLKNVFCDHVKCYAVTPDKIILKSDGDHPSLEGAKMINNLIIREIEKTE